MEYNYIICDVFTDKLFSGNQLAVIPDAQGLTDQQMQQITREFNFSESAFVFPPENGGTKKVRIFTPGAEVPFAGHPNIGTAFVLASSGAFGEIKDTTHNITFEEKAGLVDITISKKGDGKIYCELKAPQQFSRGEEVSISLLANALSIQPDLINTSTHAPQVASVGLPFIIIELKNIDTLKQAKINMDGFEKIQQTGVSPLIYFYVKDSEGYNIRARMFGPLVGVYEDPATGSASCAASALIAHYEPKSSRTFSYKIGQGFEMGRPSILESRVEKTNGEITSVWIGGNSIISCKGIISVE